MKSLLKILFIVFCLAVLAAPIVAIRAASSSASNNVFLVVGEGCGNGQIETGEECDGTAGVIPGYYCDNYCRLQRIPPPAVILPQIFAELNIYNIFVRIGADKAVINWATNKAVTCQLKWGEEQELKDGLSQEVEAKTAHSIILENLTPATDYYYQIFCRDAWGHRADSGLRQFKTEGLVDLTPPANVSDFYAEAKAAEIVLTWHNPKDSDFRAVKIRRSESFYPQTIKEGEEVYNDSGETFTDKNVKAGARYYYTAFAYDNNANYASGSLASAMITVGPPTPEAEILPLPPAPPAKPEELVKINLIDFDFFTANGTIAVKKSLNGFAFLPGTILNVKTEQKKYPKVLKSIILTLAPKDQAARLKGAKSYILQTDKQKDNYSSTFTMPVKAEDYDFQIVLLNFNNAKVAKVNDQFKIENFGRITAFNNPNLSLVRPALAAGERSPEVYAAEITLLNYQEGSFTKWRGEKYSQFNPMLSNRIGQYGFLAPNGLYMMAVKKDNYYQYASVPFKVTNNIINQDVELVYNPRLNLKRFLLVPIILILLYLILKKIIKKRGERKRRRSE